MSEISMPRLSDTMQEGTISRWLKKPGDEVKRGDVLAEVETDKANMEIEAYENGVLEQILVKEGETVPIGQTIALIGSGANVQQQSAAPAKSEASAAAATSTAQPTSPGRRARATSRSRSARMSGSPSTSGATAGTPCRCTARW